MLKCASLKSASEIVTGDVIVCNFNKVFKLVRYIDDDDSEFDSSNTIFFKTLLTVLSVKQTTIWTYVIKTVEHNDVFVDHEYKKLLVI